MMKFTVTVAFREERQVMADTRQQAEEAAWKRFAANPRALLYRLEVSAEEDTSETAYRRLMAKARCTPDYQAGAALHWMTHEERVEAIMRQLWLLGVGGYAREEVDGLLRENFRQLW